MKKLLYVGASLLGLFVFLFVGGLLLPEQGRVERSLEIEAVPTDIFAVVSNLRTWDSWTVWNTARDPSLTYVFDGNQSGAGMIMQWEGDQLDTGQVEITSADPKAGISYLLTTEDGLFESTGTIRFNASGNTTRVTWSLETQLGKSPLRRWYGVMLNSMIGSDFDNGLLNLRKIFES